MAKRATPQTEDRFTPSEAAELREFLLDIRAMLKMWRSEEALRGKQRFYLTIGGKSMADIGMENLDDLRSLMTYMDERRPRVVEFMKKLNPVGKELWDNGKLGDDVDFRLLEAEANEALTADEAEAECDNSKWALLEWKWERCNWRE